MKRFQLPKILNCPPFAGVLLWNFQNNYGEQLRTIASILRNFVKFRGKHLCQILYLISARPKACTFI